MACSVFAVNEIFEKRPELKAAVHIFYGNTEYDTAKVVNIDFCVLIGYHGLE